MKRGLLAPTGNVECDLLSFVADKQFSATSPELPASEHNRATSSTAKDGFAYCATQPLTGLVAYANMERKTQQSICQSTYEPRCKNSANPVHENRGADDGTGKSVHGLHFSKTDKIESVALSIREIRKQLHASIPSRTLRRNPKRTQNNEDYTDAKLRAKLQRNHRFKQRGPEGMKTNSYTDKFLDQHDAKKEHKARRRLEKDQTKNSKKNARWKNSVVPLPTGSDFDNLIRSGVIAKHIAKRERKQRCW